MKLPEKDVGRSYQEEVGKDSPTLSQRDSNLAVSKIRKSSDESRIHLLQNTSRL